ncbi:MAG: hypothetical protein VYB61_12075 [Verrucomicrobiota bacterium]|nr:hypothetical protein [Verrucomicrobiota bacterium]
MKIPSHIYGAIGGAAVASLAWLIFSPAANQETVSKPETKTQSHQKPISAIRNAPPLVAGDDTGLVSGTALRPESNPTEGTLSAAAQRNVPPQSPTPADRQEPGLAKIEPVPPRDELIARAVIVEEQANNRLQALTSRLGLTEEQQDRIFPILASSSPAFHPILQPEGSTDYLKDSVFGEGKAIEPGASVADVENEIYPVLDDEQKASLEEKAMDREAWWDDIVALLEEDLDQPEATVANAQTEPAKPAEQPQTTGNQPSRESSATVNEIDDFSSLLKGN